MIIEFPESSSLLPTKESPKNSGIFCARLVGLPPGFAACSGQTQIDITDRAIDRLVYELYGLTEEEVRVVGG
jgi:hypothetical protein